MIKWLVSGDFGQFLNSLRSFLVLVTTVSVLRYVLFNTGMSSFLNPAMSSLFILKYSHLNLDNIYDIKLGLKKSASMMHSSLVLKSIFDFPVIRKKIHPNYRKVSVEKMPFLACNTCNNNKFLWNVLVVLLFLWSCPCQMTGF